MISLRALLAPIFLVGAGALTACDSSSEKNLAHSLIDAAAAVCPLRDATHQEKMDCADTGKELAEKLLVSFKSVGGLSRDGNKLHRDKCGYVLPRENMSLTSQEMAAQNGRTVINCLDVFENNSSDPNVILAAGAIKQSVMLTTQP